MTAEEKKRMLALAYVVADLNAENMELEQRVHQLVDDYNAVVRQLNGNEKRNGKESSKQTLVELRQMEEQYDKLERENRELKRFAKEIHTFVKYKNLYMKKDKECTHHHGRPHACSTTCLECDSCLGVIEGVGVICRERLKEAGVVFPSDE